MYKKILRIMNVGFDVTDQLLVIFEVSTAVTMKNAIFWDVTPCGVSKERVAVCVGW
jgi:hypothetical protein